MQIRVRWFLIFLFGIFSQHRGGANELPPASRVTEINSNSWPCYTLRAEKIWQLNLPGGQPFNASGLFLRKNGDMLAISDLGPSVYKIKFLKFTNAADLILQRDCFAEKQLAPLAQEKIGHYDCEGVCEDERGRIYICEEANRWILRANPKKKTVERLQIDFSLVQKYFHPTDLEASFEGIAVHGKKLFVANERQQGRIIVVDLNSLRAVDDFVARPSRGHAKDIHYHDLCWFDGALFALLRESHVILKIDPNSKCVLAEYDFGEMESDPDATYVRPFSAGLIEGLAVDKKYFWLCTDNHGRPRKKFPNDIRPTLFKCRRTDK